MSTQRTLDLTGLPEEAINAVELLVSQLRRPTSGTTGQGDLPKAQEPSTLSDLAAIITASVPESEWAKLPSDLAKNFDHYRYGSPSETE
jgi:hypothetical protein